MEEDDDNPQQRGGGAAGVWILFLSRVAGVVDLQLGDLGGHPPHGKGPGVFQDQVVRLLMGRLLRQKPDGKWQYTLAATSREEAGFQTMEEYIRRRQNTVA